MVMVVPDSSRDMSIHTPCSHDQFIIKGSWKLRDLQQCFRNSDAKSPDPEKCEHVGPMVTTSHEGDTTKDELGDLRWLMISKNAQRSPMPKEH